VTRPDDDGVLPDQTRDDTDVGWGDDVRRDAEDDEDLRRLLDERPPHHIDHD
jgi:hypothetical protein